MIALLKKLRSYCGVYFKLRYYLNTKNLIQVYLSLIESHLRYGIIVWNHGNKTIVYKMQHICNEFISFINSNKQTGKHNFLPINNLHILSTSLFMYKLKHNILPEIFLPLFQYNKQIYTIPTRSNSSFHLPFFFQIHNTTISNV